MKIARCLKHVPFEGPAAFEPILNQLDYRVECHLVPQDGLPPDAGDLLLVMGGPMSANDPDPWIAEEIAFIRQAVDDGVPLLGVCLGSQLLARAVDALCRQCPQDIAAARTDATRIRQGADSALPDLNARAAAFLTALCQA